LFNNILSSTFIFQFIAIVISLSIHEFAHAWSADLLGDRTARMNGRVTLNPLAHLEPLGLIMILFAPIGWAKPTPVNASNFKRPRLDSILVTFAGPFSNLVLALICFALMMWVFPSYFTNSTVSVSDFLSQLVYMGFLVNISLFVFNLIPIPPLDGSRIVSNLLPYRYAVIYHRLDLYGPFILLLLVMLPPVRNGLLLPLFSGVIHLIVTIFGY
jgi:Zn-dependent protease